MVKLCFAFQNLGPILAGLEQFGNTSNWAALTGFHFWRGEELDFTVKVPCHAPAYVAFEIVDTMYELSKNEPRDHLILRLMGDVGLRREEVVNLRVKNANTHALRFRGKGDKDRTVPLTEELAACLTSCCA